jgi:hypothetical protein
MTSDGEVLYLSFLQHYTVERGVIGWKVCTRSYMYSVDTGDGEEIVAFHWHPEAIPDNPVPFPHLHISPGAGNGLRREVRDSLPN